MTCMLVPSSPNTATIAFALILAGTAFADEAPARPRGGHTLGADMAALDAAVIRPPTANDTATVPAPVAATVAVTK